MVHYASSHLIYFYVNYDLIDLFHVQERGYSVDINTTFEEFSSMLTADKRSFGLDAGNIKLTFNSVSGKILIFMTHSAIHVKQSFTGKLDI